MELFGTMQELWTWPTALLAASIILVVLAVGNYAAALWAERQNPPEGAFLEVDGVPLH